jgi:hypothetical protein
MQTLILADTIPSPIFFSTDSVAFLLATRKRPSYISEKLKMKTILILCFSLLTVGNGIAQRSEFHWLIGTWKVPGANEFERWTSGDTSHDLTGVAFRIHEGDTVITEAITLTHYEGAFHYVPDVAGDQPPIDFKVTSYDATSFIAQNPKHDFPKIIRYKRIVVDNVESIEAAIEGNGKVIPYTFKKQK